MINSRFLIVVAAASFAGSVAIANVASAAPKKMSYEQAWTLCKAELDQQGVFGTGLSVAARSAAGGGCMQKHGYRMKKKTKF